MEVSQFISSLLCHMQQTLLEQRSSPGHISSVTMWCLPIDDWLHVKVFVPILVVTWMKSTIGALSAIDGGYIPTERQNPPHPRFLRACGQDLGEVLVGGT